MLSIELLQNIFHLFVRTNLMNSDLLQLAKRFLHSLIQTYILRGQNVLAFWRYFVNNFEVFGVSGDRIT